MDSFSRQKTIKDIVGLKNTINQLDIIGIHKIVSGPQGTP